VWGSDAIVYSGDELIRSTVRLVRTGWAGTLEPEQRYPYWVTFAKVTEATPPDAKILLRGSRPSLNLDRTVHLDLQWLQANYYYAPLRNARQLHALYRKRKITHLLYRRGVHYSGTLQSSVLFAELVHRIGGQHPNFRGFELVPLPPDPPTTREQLAVLVLGIREFYPDGLYRVEDLDVYGRMDRREREKPKPRRSLRVEGLEALLPKADAVLVGRPNRQPPETKALLQKDFVLFESLEAVEIHLRKEIRPEESPEQSPDPSAVAPAPAPAPDPAAAPVPTAP